MTNPNGDQLVIASDEKEMAEAGANLFFQAAKEALASNPRFNVVLSGGSTPRGIYRAIADHYRHRVNWDQIHFFWSDERQVPIDDPDSNYKMAYETLLSRVPVLDQNVHRVPVELGSARLAAEAYEDLLQWHRADFDLSLLGLGDDGHTASLFPKGDPNPFQLTDSSSRVIAVRGPGLKHERISLTPRALNASKQVIFVVSGEKKAKILRDVLNHKQGERPRFPAQLIHPERGQVMWLVDQAAASLLAPPRAA